MQPLRLLFLAQLLVLASFGQEHYNFIHYPAESGIISYQINTAVQDAKGYMWFGSTNGLQRFDGIRFKTFRHDDKNPNSIPANPVWQLLVDKKQRLWILLYDGTVGIFDTGKFIFQQVPTKFKRSVSPNTFLKRLSTDEAGNLFYLISGSEVISFDEKQQAFSYESNVFKQKEGWLISDFIQQPGTNNYWFSLVNGGLALYNAVTGNLSDAGNNVEKNETIKAFNSQATYNSLFFDVQKRLWATHQEAQTVIDCYEIAHKQFALTNYSLYPQIKSHFEIKRFLQQDDGTIWVYGLQVMAKFIDNDKRFQLVYNGYQNEHSIVYEMVHCLYEDKEKNIWVGTDNNGLYRFNPSKEFFGNMDHINRANGKKGDGNVLSFLRLSSGNLLVGTWNDGLYLYDRNFNPVPLNIRGIDNNCGPCIWSMAASRDSNILWMGGQPGFYSLDQKKRISQFFNPGLLDNSTIRQIVEDRKGNLWIGTENRGVFTSSVSSAGGGISIENLKKVDAVPAVQINKITVDSKGKIWVGTPENGLYVLDAASQQLELHFSDQESNEKKLPERGISSILEYNDSIILITTATRVVKYNRLKKETKIVGGANFISGFITAIERDDMGYLWLTSTSGLYQIDLYKVIFILYDRTDGLDSEHFIQSASYVLPDGKMLFGATHNFIFFTPGIKGQQATSNVKITDIKLQNKSLNADSIFSLNELQLGYDEKPLVIEFSPFLFFNGVTLVKYQMEGLDKEWNMVDRSYQAVYNYLPPGEYNFKIKPSDFMGNLLDPVVLLRIKVKSPFWKTWWFYSLLALFAAALLYLLDRQRTSRKDAVQRMRSEIADDLHQEVNSALGHINILSEVARLKAATEPQKSMEFIEQIHTKSQNMIFAMDDMLWSISPENDSMEKTILRLKEYIESLKIRYAVDIDLLVDKNVNLLQLNMKQRKDIFWFFKSGISNVARTGGKNCLIHIAYDKPNLSYTLEFDTSNIDLNQLNNLRQRQELKDKITRLNARLDVQELKSKTIFLLTIPVSQ